MAPGLSSAFTAHTSISNPIHWKRSEVLKKPHLAWPNTRKKFATVAEYPRNKPEEKPCPSPEAVYWPGELKWVARLLLWKRRSSITHSHQSSVCTGLHKGTHFPCFQSCRNRAGVAESTGEHNAATRGRSFEGSPWTQQPGHLTSILPLPLLLDLQQHCFIHTCCNHTDASPATSGVHNSVSSYISFR